MDFYVDATTPGPVTISSRAVDDSGNTQTPPAEITVTVRTPVTIRVASLPVEMQEIGSVNASRHLLKAAIFPGRLAS
jgi:hypothetical protein